MSDIYEKKNLSCLKSKFFQTSIFIYLQTSECNVIHTQRTPDICKFLGLKVPESGGSNETAKIPTTTATTITTTTTTTTPTAKTTAKVPDANGGGSEHPAEHTGSVGGMKSFFSFKLHII